MLLYIKNKLHKDHLLPSQIMPPSPLNKIISNNNNLWISKATSWIPFFDCNSPISQYETMRNHLHIFASGKLGDMFYSVMRPNLKSKDFWNDKWLCGFTLILNWYEKIRKFSFWITCINVFWINNFQRYTRWQHKIYYLISV